MYVHVDLSNLIVQTKQTLGRVRTLPEMEKPWTSKAGCVKNKDETSHTHTHTHTQICYLNQHGIIKDGENDFFRNNFKLAPTTVIIGNLKDGEQERERGGRTKEEGKGIKRGRVEEGQGKQRLKEKDLSERNVCRKSGSNIQFMTIQRSTHSCTCTCTYMCMIV